MSTKIKVMTFNLRFQTVTDGKNSFEHRKERIMRMLRTEAPDVIGFQEVTDSMLAWLKENLSDYYVLGHGRNSRYKGEAIPIAYRKDCFDLHAFREEWLSIFPNKPESLMDGLDQSVCPRTFCCAELIHTDSDTPFAFYNVHTDHKGELARVAECTLLLRDVGASPYRFVLTGDFNAYPNSAEIRLIQATSTTLGTVDTTSAIKGSFHGFRGEVGKCKIDYIFSNLSTDPRRSYAVPDEGANGCYYSDHRALCAYVEV